MMTLAQIEEYMHRRKLEFDAQYLRARQLSQPELLTAWQSLQVELDEWTVEHKRISEKLKKMRRVMNKRLEKKAS